MISAADPTGMTRAPRGVIVRGALPFDGEPQENATRFVDLAAIAQIAEHSRKGLLSAYSAFDLGIALVGGSLVSTIAGKGVWSKARYGLLLSTESEKLYLLVQGAEIAPLSPEAEFFDVSALVERAMDIVRSERTRF